MNTTILAPFFASRGWHGGLKCALDGAIERGKNEIIADVVAGPVPRECNSFADLHDYVDANEYGCGLDDLPIDEPAWDEFMAFADHVQCAVDRWIRAGGIRRQLDGEET
jgi:hypothetical protein